MHAARRRLPSPAMLVALAALFVALGGVSYAALAKDSVRSKHIKNGQVKSVDVANNAIRGADVDEASLGPVPRAIDADAVGGLAAAELARKDDILWVEFANDGTVLNASHPGIEAEDSLAYGVKRAYFPRDVSECLLLSQTAGSDDQGDSPSLSTANPVTGQPNGVEILTELAEGSGAEADTYKVLVLCP